MHSFDIIIDKIYMIDDDEDDAIPLLHDGVLIKNKVIFLSDILLFVGH